MTQAFVYPTVGKNLGRSAQCRIQTAGCRKKTRLSTLGDHDGRAGQRVQREIELRLPKHVNVACESSADDGGLHLTEKGRSIADA